MKKIQPVIEPIKHNTSYYLRKCKDNMFQAMQIKDGIHQALHVEDTLGIALNTLMNRAKNEVVNK